MKQLHLPFPSDPLPEPPAEITDDIEILLDKLAKGMSPDEVMAVLGEPNHSIKETDRKYQHAATVCLCYGEWEFDFNSWVPHELVAVYNDEEKYPLK